ncbi:hypothetical protein ACWEWQ_28570, partial [Streptomyces sp. NPDC003832]
MTEQPVEKKPAPTGRWRRQLRVTLPGCWGALLLACLSFTPSLLPRGGVVRQMPLNAPPHAIHGTARDGAWRTARAG